MLPITTLTRGRLLGLGVLPGARARYHSRPVDLNFEGMVFVRTVSGETFEGEDIKGIRVHNASCDLARYIVVRIKNQASTLVSENLQRQISDKNLFGCSYSFQKLLVIKRSQSTRIRHAQGIDTVERDTSPSQLVRKRHDRPEDSLLIFWAQFDARAGKNGQPGLIQTTSFLPGFAAS